MTAAPPSAHDQIEQEAGVSCPRDDGPPRGAPRVFAVAGALALALAVALRVAFLGSKPFWGDEAWVATLAEMPLPRVLEAIPHTTAPVGFVLVVKVTSLIPGLRPEVAMRLLPLAAGIATVFLLPRLVRALGGSPRAATLVTVVAAAVPALVHYSRELKPYAIDALVATAFPLAALRLMARCEGEDAAAGGPPPRLLPAAMAFLTPFFSFGGVFPVAATLAWGWGRLLRRGGAAARRHWALVTALFFLPLATAGSLLIYRQATNPLLVKYFAAGAAGSNPSPATAAASIATLLGSVGGHLFPGAAVAGLAAAGIGLAVWPARHRGAAIGIAGGSILLAAITAAAGLYSVRFGRLVLFAAPFALAAACVALDRALAWIVRPVRLQPAATAVALALAASLAAFWTARDLSHRLHPERTHWRTAFLYDNLKDVPALVEETLRRRGPGEPVFIAHAVRRSTRYYSRGRLSEGFSTKGGRARNAEKALEAWLSSVPERGWLMLTRAVASPGLRKVIAQGGLAVVGETPFHGVVLWEVRRRAGPG